MKKKFKIAKIILALIIVIILLCLHFAIGENELGQSNINTLIILPISLVTYLLISYNLYIKMFKKLKKGQIFDEVFLTLVATIAAFCIQEYVEALAVVVFFQIGEMFEEYALNKSRSSIKSILSLRPDVVNVIEGDEIIAKDPNEVEKDTVFLVKPGERVPLDGIIIEGNSTFDYSSMTGESIPVSLNENSEIISGVINLTSPIKVKSTKEFYNSTIAKILDVVENATNVKTNSEKFITKFSKIYTPIVCLLALLFSVIPPLFLGIDNPEVWSSWILTGASFLVVSCPCALVLSVPMAYFVGIGQASKYKVLVKGSNFLESINKADTIVFDKTGTLTKGNFEVTNVDVNEKNCSYDKLAELAIYAESYSNHPIAQAIRKVKSIEVDKDSLKDYKEISGKGIIVTYQNKSLIAGNDKLLEDNGIEFNKSKNIGTIIYIAFDNEYCGSFTIKDTIKPTTKSALVELKKQGFKNTYMLSGDNTLIAEEVGKECGIGHVKANLLPLDKTSILEKILAESKQNVVFVGDGVNDSPSLIMADVGISMGGIGSDAAIEASDVVIMDDDLNRIVSTKKIAKSTIYKVYQNIFFAIGVKIAILALNVLDSFFHFGLGSYIMWLAIFGDVGVTVLCTLNSIRIMLKKY